MKIIKHICNNVFIRVTTLNKKLDIGLSIVCTNSFSNEGVGVFLGTKESSSASPSSSDEAGRIGPIYIGSYVSIL